MFLAYHWVIKYDKTWILLKQVQTTLLKSQTRVIEEIQTFSFTTQIQDYLAFHNISRHFLTFPDISWHFPTFPDISCHFLSFPAEIFWQECWEIGGLFCGGGPHLTPHKLLLRSKNWPKRKKALPYFDLPWFNLIKVVTVLRYILKVYL